MTEKFTQGEWKVLSGINLNIRTICKLTERVSVVADKYVDEDNVFSDAHLIAAAPEMYRMLVRLSAQLTDINAHDAAKDVEQLLAKARVEV